MWTEGSRAAGDAVWGRLTAGLAELCRKPGTKAGRRRRDETDNKAIADCLYGEEPGLEKHWSASTLNRWKTFTSPVKCVTEVTTMIT